MSRVRRGAQFLTLAFAALSAVLNFYNEDWLKVGFVAAIILSALLAWELWGYHSRDVPKLTIEHTPDGQGYWMPGSNLHRVSVRNIGERDAEDVQLSLRRIDPDPHLRIDVIPSKFGHKGGNCGDGGRICVISPEEEPHFFDVIAFLPNRDEAGNFTDENWCWRLVTVEYMYQPIDLEIGRDYDFCLQARANGARAVKSVLLVRNNGDGTLDVRMALNGGSVAA
jgi:hypothetical protein